MIARRLHDTAWFAGLVVLSVVAIRPAAASVGDHFQPVSAEELAMKSQPQAPGAPAIILFRQVDRDDQGNHEFNYVRIKVLTEEGRRYADVEIPYSKEAEEIKDLEARTIRPDGLVARYDGKIFEKTIVKVKGWKYLAKTFTLPEVQVGSVIEYYYTCKFKGGFPNSHWILSDELFTKRAAFSLRPHSGPGYTLGLTWSNLPTGTERPVMDKSGVYRLAIDNIPAFPVEDYMPPTRELKSRVDFVYKESPSGIDDYWHTIGKEVNEWLEKFTDKHKAMQEAVSQIVSPTDPAEVKLQKIYLRVQQMHNRSYEEEKTRQEEKRDGGKYNRNVEDIWKSGYGTGFDLPWLYLALARAAGFEAYGVLASSRRDYFFSPTVEDAHRLNSSLVLVKLNGKEIYCDPGDKFAPFGTLPWPETAVFGLRLDKNGGSWIKTPVPASSESRVWRKADLKLSDTGDLQGKMTLTFTGLTAIHERTEERNQDEAERKKHLEEYVREVIPSAAEVELTNRPDWDNPAVPLAAEFNLKVSGWASAGGRRILIPVGLFAGPEKHLFEHASRVHPIYMEFPFQKVDDITIELPSGWQVSSLPSGQNNTGRVVSCVMKADNQNGKVHLTRTLDVSFLLMETKYYGALRNFFQQVRSGDEQQVVLQPGLQTANK